MPAGPLSSELKFEKKNKDLVKLPQCTSPKGLHGLIYYQKKKKKKMHIY